ncbi:hypothetical protein ACOR62_06100 [Neisseria lisongii]|nr:hypothetical protein [Neisseria lisongii]
MSENPDYADFRETEAGQAFARSAGKPGASYNPSLPQYESSSDGSTTYATLSEGRLKTGGQETTVQELGINSDSSSAHKSVNALPDLAEITEKQQTVAKATADIANAVRTFSSSRAEAAQQQSKAAEKALEAALQSGDTEAALAAQQQLETAQAAAKDWGIGGSKSRALNAVTALTTGILGGQSDLQAAANAAAPYAAAAIGERFGHGADKNEVAQTVGHFLLGATLAYLNNGDPLTGGSAAVAAEKAAEHLSQQYNDGKTAIDPQTGEFNPNLLPEAVKEEIKATTGAIASIVGATGDGGAALNAQISGVLGQNAVENNELKKLTDLYHPNALNSLAKTQSLAVSVLQATNGDVKAVMNEISKSLRCTDCYDPGKAYVNFLVTASGEVTLTVATAGAGQVVIKGGKVANWLMKLQKAAKNNKTTNFVINGTANAAISAVANEDERKPGNLAYNFVVGGTAAHVTSRMSTPGTIAFGQGVVHGYGELAKHTLHGDGKAPPSTSDVLANTSKAFAGGYLGGFMGSKVTSIMPNASKNAKTTVDAFFGSTTSALFGYTVTPNKKQDSK